MDNPINHGCPNLNEVLAFTGRRSRKAPHISSQPKNILALRGLCNKRLQCCYCCLPAGTYFSPSALWDTRPKLQPRFVRSIYKATWPAKLLRLELKPSGRATM